VYVETMVAAFGLEDPSLRLMGEIVHEIDLRDGRYVHPETAVIDAVLKGWLLMGSPTRNSKLMAWPSSKGSMPRLPRRAAQAMPQEGVKLRGKEIPHEVDHT